MNAAELFIKCLEAHGMQYIFGVPGEENAEFMMQLQDSTIEFILTRHEQGAAFMADVYGRLTGKAAGCLGTLGPGATNLVTGVADANMDRAPCFVITGQGSSTRLHKESHQAMDVVQMFRPITKWTHSVIRGENIPEMVHKAMRIAEEEKPGACHIELPEDIASMPAGGVPFEPEKVRRPVPDDKIMDQVLEIIQNAKRPVILAGNGTIRKRASKQLRRFVDFTGIGVVSTFMGKGCIPRDHECYLYTAGLQAKDYPDCALAAADVVIALGYDLVEYHPSLWNSDQKATIINCDFVQAEVDNNYRVTKEVVGDLAHTLWMLNERVQDLGLDFRSSQQKSLRKHMERDLEEYCDQTGGPLIKPQKIIWDARQVLGPEDILLSDVGAHKMWIARQYHCDEPNTCLISNGFCSMGFALPGAIAAQLVYPERRIMAMCGDGGLMMNIQEMETAARLNTNIVLIAWVDNKYGLIEWKQDTHYGRHTNLDFGNPDFPKLAELFGWAGFHVDKAEDLHPTMEEAFKTGKPALIAVQPDNAENNKLTKRLGQLVCPI